MTTSALKKQLIQKMEQVRLQDLKLLDALLDQLLLQQAEEMEISQWLSPEQTRELKQRDKAIEKGEAQFSEWAQVKNRVRKAMHQKK